MMTRKRRVIIRDSQYVKKATLSLRFVFFPGDPSETPANDEPRNPRALGKA